MEKWRQLMELLEKKRRALGGFSELLGMFRDIESIQAEMKEMEVLLIYIIAKWLTFVKILVNINKIPYYEIMKLPHYITRLPMIDKSQPA